ncbi:glycosyltransferase [Actinocorallia sp. B10E7]|uniref:glycosyltransferase n=1 Tax=Actinocorallia sp. B10E7 TaxID=3153558 RepID=UPI00325E450C
MTAPRPQLAPSVPARLISLAAFLLLAFAALRYATPRELTVLGYILLGLLSLKLVLSLCYRPVPLPQGHRTRLDAAVIVPIYNEDPEILRRCLDTLMRQSAPARTVMVVDDGSSSEDAARVAVSMIEPFQRHGIRLLVLRQPRNMGKREALARGFQTVPQADVYIGVDSDTVLEREAFAQLLAPMEADEKVTGVTGMVLASNYRTNVLTRLIELRYANAFLYERAAYSMLKTVLCCCGSLAAYRGWVVHKYLDDFRTQKFLGQPAVVGDDRRLTNYCLLEGEVLLQSSALAETAVPERMNHYLRQQSRWNRSFFRETLWCLKTFPTRRPMGFLLSGIEVSTWLVFTATLLYSLLLHPILTGELLIAEYCAMIVCFGYLRSVRYLDLPRPGVGFLEKLGIFLMAPLYGLMHIVLLLPIRVFSLLTLRTASWGTRSTVEVAAEPSGPIPGPRPQQPQQPLPPLPQRQQHVRVGQTPRPHSHRRRPLEHTATLSGSPTVTRPDSSVRPPVPAPAPYTAAPAQYAQPSGSPLRTRTEGLTEQPRNGSWSESR